MRDPEAEAAKKREEERRVAEQFQKDQAAIEARHDLTPLQREELSLTLKKLYAQRQQFAQFVEMAEARQRAERDQIFTGAGLLGVVGEAAMNTPSMVGARADAMAHSPIYRAQARAESESAFRQADAAVAAGIPQAKSRAVLAQADVLANSGTEQAGAKVILKQVDALSKQGVTQATVEHDAAVVSTVATGTAQGAGTEPVAATGPLADVPAASTPGVPPMDAFSLDRGKKVYVEFEGSPTQTRKLRENLAARGHILTEKRDNADVVYLFDGAYVVPENKQYDGIRVSAGTLLENPDKPIAAPEKKLTGSIGSGFSKFILVMAAAQGANIPQSAIPKEQDGFSQKVLLVVARQPKGGAETRFSVMKETESATMVGPSLVKEADEEMVDRLGIGAQTTGGTT